MTTLDHPRVRAAVTCPLCDLDKDAGAVFCWPCYRLWNFRHGASAMINDMVDTREAELTCDPVKK